MIATRDMTNTIKYLRTCRSIARNNLKELVYGFTTTEFPKMDPHVKEQWLKALRSDEYKQGRGALMRIFDDSAEYCCLGVVCVANPQIAGFRDHGYSGVKEFFPISNPDYHGDTMFLGFDLRIDTGIADDVQRFLAYCNDGVNPDRPDSVYAGIPGEVRDEIRLERQDFASIAQWIEENL